MTMLGNFVKASTPWVKSLLKLADTMEREEWGDDTTDSDGKKKSTSAQYATERLSSHE